MCHHWTYESVDLEEREADDEEEPAVDVELDREYDDDREPAEVPTADD